MGNIKVKKVLAIFLLLTFLWWNLPIKIAIQFAHADSILVATSSLNQPSSYTWAEIDHYLQKQLEKASSSTEEFAKSELDYWKRDLMKNVDNQFLNWYFSYGNQKAMEFGIPFAWLAFKLDRPLKVFRSEDEKSLNASEIIKKRMVEDFDKKFKQLVLNQDAENSLRAIIERVSRNYSSAVGTQFSRVKAHYRVPDQEWEKHLGNIAKLTYDTGSSKSNLDSESFNSNLFTKVFSLTTIAVSTKLAIKFASKAGAKVATKAGASVVLKSGAQMLDPLLAVGFLAYDIWDYNRMVSSSRPELRQNISDYLDELEYSILTGNDGILAALSEVKAYLYNEIGSLSSSPPT